MKKRRDALAITFRPVAAKLLCDFVNSRPEPHPFEEFKWKWGDAAFVPWPSGLDHFIETQTMVRRIWEGEEKGNERLRVEIGLGLKFPREEYVGVWSPVYVDWDEGTISPYPRDLCDVIWFALLQYHDRLAICDNKDSGCPTPYFIRTKKQQRFCSDGCSVSAQRQYKRNWWNEHGEAWRQKRKKQRARSEPRRGASGQVRKGRRP